MEAKNLDWKAIKLRCGHRSPNHNKVVGGADISAEKQLILMLAMLIKTE
jgi:hypothetical protein